MKLYSIMPLDMNHVGEVCDDIERQYATGVATEVLFMLAITPEGFPVIDKAAIGMEKFSVYRDELAKRGISAGVLVQATIGHGYQLTTRIPFTPLVGASDGAEKYVACPYDEKFRKYIRKSFATIAGAKPSSIMVDDDFRLFARSYNGCACSLHMKEISKRFGRDITREEMWASFDEDTEQGRTLMDIFYDTQIDSLIGAAREMRAGIDEVDPTMQGSFCVCGDTCEGAGEIAKILAGKGNPVILRVNNAKYCSPGARGITRSMARAAIQKAVLKNDVDCFLAETDTCPQNRYSTSAAALHAHFTCSILEGMAGAKHWITRLGAFEPKSGEAYRKKLAKYAGMYRKLSDIVPDVEWLGARIPLSDKPWTPKPPISSYEMASDANAWASCVLERLGLPMYYSERAGGAVFMDGRRDEFFTDEEIKNMLSDTAFLAVESAVSLIKRGFGEYLGVDIREATDADPTPSGEIIHATGEKSALQMSHKVIIPTSDATAPRSTVFTCPDGKANIPLYPGVTTYKNPSGGTVNVFSGTPNARFVYFEAFSFLNESRKAQLVEMMSESGNLPIYYPGDAEVYLKAGRFGDKLLVAFTNIGLDNLDEITLVSEKAVNRMLRIAPDGSYVECEFSLGSDGVITVNTAAEILGPVILIVE